ncbi:hypothetical protein CoNPh26_CDS0106 [Staphylococcus phage S-CoN_Ph26]|nr:hypothetical protein CoNPh26_CDS0106 [Staphylococcus phage S-CoN_Ph26]
MEYTKTSRRSTDGLNQYLDFRQRIKNVDKVKLGDDITIIVQMQKGEYLRVYDTNENYDFMLVMTQLNDIGTVFTAFDY